MDWELTKENCVPVRQGRSKAALQELADPAADALEAKRRELWAEVAEYKGDDPLEPWQRYIKWMQEYGVGGGKADLLKVLEACTKELQKYPRYNNDIRFLRIWIQYADCLPDPADVFLFLKEKGIGRGFALYYEAYATYYELRGNFQSADAVYTDGVQRGAKPLDRLKQKHVAFQQRMAHRIQRRIQDEQVVGPPAPEPVRSSLSTLGVRPGARSNPAAQQPPSIFGAEAPRQSTSLFGSRRGPPAAQDQRGLRPPIGVVEDEEFGRGGGSLLGLPGYSSMPQVNNLRELKPHSVVSKENLDRRMAWNQAALQPGMGGGGGSGLDIFTDEEFQDGGDDKAGTAPKSASGGPERIGPSGSHPLLFQFPASDAPTGVSALMSSLAPPTALVRNMPAVAGHAAAESLAAAQARPAAPTREESSSRDRLHNNAASVNEAAFTMRQLSVSGSGRQGEPDSVPAAAGHGALAAGPAGMGGCQPAQGQPTSSSCHETPQDDGGEEMSYEELRAAAWFRSNPLPCTAVPDTASTAGTAAISANNENAQACSRAASAQAPATAACAASQTAGRTASGDWGAACRPAYVNEPSDVAGPAPRRLPFGQVARPTAPEQQPQQRPVLTPPDDLGSSGDAPWGTSDAAAAARPKRRPLGEALQAVPVSVAQPPAPESSGVVAAAPQPVPAGLEYARSGDVARGCSQKHEDAQPTVTISTRGAFDLLNSMFSEDLPHQQRRALQQKPAAAGGLQPTSAAAQPARAQEPCPAAAVPACRPVQRPGAQPPAAPAAASACEPTVTLHTRLAFDALNDMFSDTLPHEAARKLVRRAAAETGAASSNRPNGNAEVRCPADAGQVAGAEAVCATTISGTGTLTRKASCAAAALPAASTLGIHEDTFFLGPAAASISGAGCARGGNSSVRQPQAQPQKQDVSAIYEDTEFIPRAASRRDVVCGPSSHVGQGGEGFILEDTEFMTRPQARFTRESYDGGAAAGTENFAASATTGQAPAVPQSHAKAIKVDVPGFTSRTVGHAETSRIPADRPGRALGGTLTRQKGGISSRGLEIYEDTQYLG